ncbi:serine hydrolase domain-containing protein [Sphingopyxis sp. BE249]|uniref:serine hydrolase domain-containing protein n=2 Tax=Sphingopyxis TaxID=165697 RepID=UPI00286187E8|nr:serine hydrolase domain-containing protein [Sphingopyxis sp. BE249]MDR7179296.1 CubicO group peptidase (beta-lactamase class C family) [Sphingopyxis sp. BE249]
MSVRARAGTHHADDNAAWIPSETLVQELPRLMRIAGVPGVAVAVVDRGRLAWSRSFGVKNILTRDPVREDTLFEAASMTKPVFAYVVMRLADEKRLDLDKPLARYRRPANLGIDPNIELITARQVLAHSTGLPNWAFEPLVTSSAPGSRYTYSGEAFIWLQLVVETIMGMGLGSVMQAKLFGPAGMSHSSFGWDEAIARSVVFGHSEPPEGEQKLPSQPTRELGDRLLRVASKWRKPIASWTYEDSVAAMRETDPKTPPSTHDLLVNSAGGLLMTASDYAKFMVLMMDRPGRADWEISDAARRAMLTPQLEVRGRDISRGLGWELEQSSSGQLFQHSGSNYGIFKTLGVGDARSGRAIVVFTNAANGNALASRIVRQATGIDRLKSLV